MSTSFNSLFKQVFTAVINTKASARFLLVPNCSRNEIIFYCTVIYHNARNSTKAKLYQPVAKLTSCTLTLNVN